MTAQLSARDITRWSQHVEQEDHWNNDFDLPSNTSKLFSDPDSTLDTISRKWSDFDDSESRLGSVATSLQELQDDDLNKTIRPKKQPLVMQDGYIKEIVHLAKDHEAVRQLAEAAGIPLPKNLPTSALSGNITRLGPSPKAKRNVKKEDWDEDIEITGHEGVFKSPPRANVPTSTADALESLQISSSGKRGHSDMSLLNQINTKFPSRTPSNQPYNVKSPTASSSKSAIDKSLSLSIISCKSRAVASIPSPKSRLSPTKLSKYPESTAEDLTFDADFILPEKMEKLELGPRLAHSQSKLFSDPGSEDWDSPHEKHRMRLSMSSASTFSPSSSASSIAEESEDAFDELEIPDKLDAAQLKNRLDIRKHRARETELDDFLEGLEIKDGFDFSPQKLYTAKQKPNKILSSRQRSNNRRESVTIAMQQEDKMSTPRVQQKRVSSNLLSPPSTSITTTTPSSGRVISRKQSIAALKSQSSKQDKPLLKKKSSMPSLRTVNEPILAVKGNMKRPPRSPSDSTSSSRPTTQPSFMIAGPLGQTCHHVSMRKLTTPVDGVISTSGAGPLAVPKRSGIRESFGLSGGIRTGKGRHPGVSGQPNMTILRKPKGQKSAYGDGTELDGFEDLPTSFENENKYRVTPVNTNSGRLKRTWSEASPHELLKSIPPILMTTGKSTTSSTISVSTNRKGHNGNGISTNTRRKNRHRNSKAPILIRNLNTNGQSKRIGDMVYDPKQQKWIGNELVLTEFDNVQTSPLRPALITHGSIGTLKRNQSKPPITPADLSRVSTRTNSPISGPNVRVVGDMLFDPEKLRWIHMGGSDMEEDVFAHIDDEDWTIDHENDSFTRTTVSLRSEDEDEDEDEGEDQKTIRAKSLPMGDWTPMGEFDLTDEFLREAAEAETSHYKQLSHWILKHGSGHVVDRSYLFEIRDIATGL